MPASRAYRTARNCRGSLGAPFAVGQAQPSPSSSRSSRQSLRRSRGFLYAQHIVTIDGRTLHAVTTAVGGLLRPEKAHTQACTHVCMCMLCAFTFVRCYTIILVGKVLLLLVVKVSMLCAHAHMNMMNMNVHVCMACAICYTLRLLPQFWPTKGSSLSIRSSSISLVTPMSAEPAQSHHAKRWALHKQDLGVLPLEK